MCFFAGLLFSFWNVAHLSVIDTKYWMCPFRFGMIPRLVKSTTLLGAHNPTVSEETWKYFRSSTSLYCKEGNEIDRVATLEDPTYLKRSGCALYTLVFPCEFIRTPLRLRAPQNPNRVGCVGLNNIHKWILARGILIDWDRNTFLLLKYPVAHG